MSRRSPPFCSDEPPAMRGGKGRPGRRSEGARAGQARRPRAAVAVRATAPTEAGPPPAGLLHLHLPAPAGGLDLDRVRAAVAAGDAITAEVLVGEIGDDEERFLDVLGSLEDLLAAAPDAQVAILEPSRVTEEVAMHSALLAEVAYRQTAPIPIPVVHEVVPTCNNHCAHCAVVDLRAHRPGGGRAPVEQALAKLAAGGATRVMFGIEELALHPDFLEFLQAAWRHGFQAIHVATNGRPFAEGDLAARAVAAGATHFQVFIHGPDAATHDGLTGVPGSFAETLAGVRRLEAAGAAVIVSTIVSRANVDRLGPLMDLVATIGVRHALLIHLPLQGKALARAAELLVPLAVAAPRLVAAAEHGETLGLRVGLAGVPYCLAPGAERFIGVDDLVSVYDADPGEVVRLKPPFVRPRPCMRCAAYAICRGISESYLGLLGSGELRPIDGPRVTRRPPAPLAEYYQA
jgi:hypothetical protein